MESVVRLALLRGSSEVRMRGPGIAPRAIASRNGASLAEPGLAIVVHPAMSVVYALPAPASVSSTTVSPSPVEWNRPAALKCQPT
jgi:hypothetical protein